MKSEVNVVDNNSKKNNELNSSKEPSTIAIINGPNINILGIREPDIYGNETWDNIEEHLKDLGVELGVRLIFFQSNHEGFIVDFLHENLKTITGVVINPAAYTKTGYAILDALTSIDIPFVEVHLSNIFERGGWHAESIFADKAVGHVIGFKGFVYDLGLRAVIDFINRKSKNIKGGK
jgi:3-dehydroquinate dehydratase II